MKTILKNKLTYLIALLAVACLMLFAGLAIKPVAKVEAANATQNVTDVFTFKTGASVRIDTDGDTSGIRFTATFQEDFYLKATAKEEVKEVGMIIVPDSYITAYEKLGGTDYFEFITSKTGLTKEQFSVVFPESKMISEGDGVYSIRGALVKIRAKNYELVYRAVAYYQDSEGVYHYTLNDDGRSVSDVSIKAIQKESERGKEYADKELDVLYTYANGRIPRVVYDANKESNISKLSLSAECADQDVSVSRTLEDGTQWFVYDVNQALTTAGSSVIVDNNLENITISQYDYVFFKVKTNRNGAQCNYIPVDSIEGGSGWDELTANEELSVIFPVDDFVLGDQYGYKLITKGLQAGDKVYLSSFTAITEASVKGLIDSLPTEGVLSVAEKKNVSFARDFYKELSRLHSADSLDAARIDKAERLAMKALDVSTQEGLNRFVYPETWTDKDDTVYENGLGVFQSMQDYSGGNWYKFTASEDDKTTYFHFDLANVDFTGYEYASFILATDAPENERVKFHSWGNWEVGGGGSADEIPSKASYRCTIPVDHLLGMASMPALVTGLKAGESFYMTDIVVYNEDGVSDRLATLTTEGYLTALEERELSMLADVRSTVSSYADLDWSKFTQAETLPMVAIEPTDEGSLARIQNADTLDVSVETDEEGMGWYKLTAKDASDRNYFNWITEHIDFSRYTHVIYSLRTDSASPTAVGIGSNIQPDGIQYLPESGMTTIALERDNFVAMVNDMQAFIVGLQPGDSFYIGRLRAVNVEHVQAMIDALPSGGVATSEDKKNIEEIELICQYMDNVELNTEKIALADGLPLKALNADNEGDLNRFTAESKLAIRRVTDENGVDWFEIEALEDLTGTYGQFDLDLSDVNLSNYEYITYDFKNLGTQKVYIGSSLVDDDDQRFGVDANATATCTVPMDIFSGQVNAPMQIFDLKQGECFYIGNMICFDKDSVQQMIDCLPTEGIMTAQQKRDIVMAEKLYAQLQGVSSVEGMDETNIAVAKLLPLLAFDPSEEFVAERWRVAEVEGDSGFKGEITSYTDANGKTWCKFTVLEEGSLTLKDDGTIGQKESEDDLTFAAFSVDVRDLDYSGYDWMLYEVRTDAPRTVYYTQGTVSPFVPYGAPGTSLAANGSQLDYAPSGAIDGLKLGGHCLITYGLKAGDSFYLSEFIAFSNDVLQNMVDTLPDPTTVTEADRAQIEQVRKYYEHSIAKDQGKGTNIERLVACEEALAAL